MGCKHVAALACKDCAPSTPDDVPLHAPEQRRAEPGKKFDAGKPPLSLIPRMALEAEARVLDFGRDKYGAHNWREGMSLSRLYDAAMRHLAAAADGEDLDPETGLPHEAHARCCLGFILELKETHPEMDDRYKP